MDGRMDQSSQCLKNKNPSSVGQVCSSPWLSPGSGESPRAFTRGTPAPCRRWCSPSYRRLRPASSTRLDKELHARPLRLSGATLLPKRKNFHTKWLVFFTFRFWRQGREVWSGWSLKAATKTHGVSAPPFSCEPHMK